MGVPAQPTLGIRGLSWLAVEQISSLPAVLTQSHAQPEPKRVAAALAKASLKASKLPKVALMSAARSPVGSPPPLGLMTVQKRLWLKWPPPLLRTAGTSLCCFIRSSRLLPAMGVPSMAALRLLT